MNSPTRASGLIPGTVIGTLMTLVLAGCATAPKPAPIEQALAVSAQQGNPRAELGLGVRLLARARTANERNVAAVWVRRAADANLAMAQARLGWMYLRGRGVPQDTSRALKWLQLGANRGAPAAQLQLAQIYANGTLVPVDKARACYWYSIAAKPARSDVTIFNIAQVRFFARTRAKALADSLSPDQLATVDRQVAAWVPASSVPYSARMSMAGFRR